MTTPMQAAIRKVTDGQSLSEQEAFSVASAIMAGQATPAQIAALLVALRVKGETTDEITGFAQAMRRGATPLPLPPEDLVDTCGTGGDGSGTFNISTVSAFVAAGAGCKVAKHGNRSISSRCGSADVLRALGVNIELPPETTARCIEQIGVGFLFAPLYHQSMKHAAGPRREIGVRSIFNILGPLANPAGAKRQLLGVFKRELTETLARVLQTLGSVHCLVVHGEDGLDEITLMGSTYVSELHDGHVRSYRLTPEDLGLKRAKPEQLAGGEPEANARIALAVLGGKPGPTRDIVLLNAAAVIHVSGRAGSLPEGVKQAAESLDSGRALGALEALRDFAPES
jgi:anthranilate phosphoribosyltransferase